MANPGRVPRAAALAAGLWLAACGTSAPAVVQIGDGLFVARARGGRGEAGEAERRSEALAAAESHCAAQGRVLAVDSLVSAPSRPGADDPSASVTFRCIEAAR